MLLPSRSALTELIHPLSEGEFFETYYGKQPFHLGNRVLDTPPLVQLDDLVARIRCLNLEFGGDYALAKNGEWLSQKFQDALEENPALLLRLLDQGGTLVVKSIQNDFLPARHLAEGLTEALKIEVRVNVYYTPAGGAGFGFHKDPLDVFVWQLLGTKLWKVLQTGCDDITDPLIETVLEPGQLIYMPENCLHSASANTGEDSLHLTIGFQSRYSLTKNTVKAELEKWFESTQVNHLAEMTLPNQGACVPIRALREEALSALDCFRDQYATMGNGSGIRTPVKAPVEPENPISVMRDLQRVEKIKSLSLSNPDALDRLNFRIEFGEAVEFIRRNQRFQVADVPLEPSALLAFCRVLIGAGATTSNPPG